MVRPYKDELLPLWRFRTPAIARASADAIFDKLLAYLRDDDFVGADMAREFLQMGYTRARRYANHAGGKKYRGPVPADRKGKSGAHGRDELPRRTGASSEQRAKAEAAAIFEERWDEAARHPAYVGQREVFRALFG